MSAALKGRMEPRAAESSTIHLAVVAEKTAGSQSIALDPAELEAQRRQLFQTGSSFAPALRENIVGIDDILETIEELVHWLRNYADYQRYQARIEPGLMLGGAPGTGKTLVARYLATASEALFINVRDFGSSHDTYMTKNDVRELFRLARERYLEDARPIVIFWDEFEINAAARSPEGDPAQVAAVAQLIAELDGVDGKNEGVLLVACTNFPSAIDGALKRAGRLGIHLSFEAPSHGGRQAILEHYLARRAHGKIDCEAIAYLITQGTSAATIEETVAEAWLIAVSRGIRAKRSPRISERDLISAWERRTLGRTSPISRLDPALLEPRALHECGHALLALAYGMKLAMVTIEPRNGSFGISFALDGVGISEPVDRALDRARLLFGGVLAEELCKQPESQLVGEDLASASKIVVGLVDSRVLGANTLFLSPSGAAAVRGQRPPHSSSITEVNDVASERILTLLYADARAALAQVEPGKLRRLAAKLAKERSITGSSFTVLVERAFGDPTRFAVRGAGLEPHRALARHLPTRAAAGFGD